MPLSKSESQTLNEVLNACKMHVKVVGEAVNGSPDKDKLRDVHEGMEISISKLENILKPKKLKDLIWESVYYGEGYHRIADCVVNVLNIRRRKTLALASVIVHYWDEKHTERSDNVEFPYSDLDEFHKLKPGTAARTR